MAETASVTVTQKQDYQFLVDFGEAIPGLLADEPAPVAGAHAAGGSGQLLVGELAVFAAKVQAGCWRHHDHGDLSH
ncbi:MAG: hypothetical protein ACYCZL_03535 [Polaromonas sp.]